MFYVVYKTTNMTNGKVYIGAHRTKKLEDDYLGSGKLLCQSIKKHGRLTFSKEILHVFDNPEEMWAKEAELVTLEWVERGDTYNLMPGGTQGDRFYQAMRNMTPKTRSEIGKKASQAHLEKMRNDQTYRERFRSNLSRSMGGTFKGEPCSWVGRRHSPATLEKMRASKVGHGAGSSNSQHGTVWLAREGEKPRKVKLEDLSTLLSEGWHRGRT